MNLAKSHNHTQRIQQTLLQYEHDLLVLMNINGIRYLYATMKRFSDSNTYHTKYRVITVM
jgi:hypothetical protein